MLLVPLVTCHPERPHESRLLLRRLVPTGPVGWVGLAPESHRPGRSDREHSALALGSLLFDRREDTSLLKGDHTVGRLPFSWRVSPI